MTDGQEEALRQVLLHFANDDNSTPFQAVKAITAILGCDSGMTLRDQFAMAAMIPLMDRAKQHDGDFHSILTLGGHEFTSEQLETMAKESSETRMLMTREAYRWADAMLEARK